MKEERIALLSQLYFELRSYRMKEFQTFIFAFPIIGAGFIPDFSNNFFVKCLITGFAVFCIFYIYKNHKRMMSIKSEIVNFQGLLKLNSDFKHLNPEDWIKKNLERHLGTFLYMVIIFIETLFLWIKVVLN